MAYGVLQFDVGFDLADLGGLSLSIVETGGATFSLNLTEGQYFLRTDAASAAGDHAAQVTGYISLVDEVERQLNLVSAGVWTVSFDASTRRVSFAHDGSGGVTAIFLGATDGAGLLGLTAIKSGSVPATFIADRTPDYYIDGDVGYWAEWREREIEPDAMVDVVAHDGTPHGIAPEGVETHLDFVVPMEPRAKVYTRAAPTSDPWTWRDTIRAVRNVRPLAVYDGEETHLIRLRREAAAFSPRSVTRDYVGHYDIPIRSRLLGRL